MKMKLKIVKKAVSEQDKVKVKVIQGKNQMIK